MFVLGLAMHGALSSPPASGELVSFKTLNTFANVGVGLPYVITLVRGRGSESPTRKLQITAGSFSWLPDC